MFGIDFEALVLLGILAFILFGPEKLPEYAGKLGYYIAKLKAASALAKSFQESQRREGAAAGHGARRTQGRKAGGMTRSARRDAGVTLSATRLPPC